MKEGAGYLFVSFCCFQKLNSLVCQKLDFHTILFARLSQAVLHCSIFLTCLIIFIMVIFLHFEDTLKQNFQNILLTFFPFLVSMFSYTYLIVKSLLQYLHFCCIAKKI